MKILKLYQNPEKNVLQVFDGTYYFERGFSKSKWLKIPEPRNDTELLDFGSDTVSLYRSLRHLPAYANRPGLQWEIDFLKNITYVTEANEKVDLFGKTFNVALGNTVTVDEELNVFEFSSKPFYSGCLKRWFCKKASHVVKQLGKVENLSEEQLNQLPYSYLASRPFSVRNTMAGMDINVAIILSCLHVDESCVENYQPTREVSGITDYLLEDILKRLGLRCKISTISKFRHKIYDLTRVA